MTILICCIAFFVLYFLYHTRHSFSIYRRLSGVKYNKVFIKNYNGPCREEWRPGNKTIKVNEKIIETQN